MSIRETFSNSIDFAVINEYDKDAVMQIWTVLGHVYHVACWRVVLRGLFRIYLTTFSESEISEMQNLCGSSFYSKSLKVLVDCKNAPRNWEKVFCFWDNCIWIGIVKLPLLRTGYFSLGANVLKRSQKIWHVNKRDVFQQNLLSSDQ